jgi:hypothetical protein
LSVTHVRSHQRHQEQQQQTLLAIVTIHDACPFFSSRIFNFADELEKLDIKYNIALVLYCLDLWSKATIRKYLPPEAMNPKKQIAGKVSAEEKKRKKKEVMLAFVGNENTSNTELGESCSFVQNEEDSTITNLTEDDSYPKGGRIKEF